MRRLISCLCLIVAACNTPPSTSSDSNYIAQSREQSGPEHNAGTLESINNKSEEMRFLRAHVQDLEKENAALNADGLKKQAELDALNTLGNDRANQITALNARIADLTQKLAAEHEQTVGLQDLYLAEKISRLRAERQLLEAKLGND